MVDLFQHFKRLSVGNVTTDSEFKPEYTSNEGFDNSMLNFRINEEEILKAIRNTKKWETSRY